MAEPDTAALMRLINGYQVSQALHVAATLRIPDLLRPGPRSHTELAAALGVHARTLYRLLRALAAAGVLYEDAARCFSLTGIGACLCSDAAGPWAAFIGRPYFWQAWGHLLHSVRTGENAFRSLHGADVWSYRATHSEEGTIFDQAMTALSRDVVAAVIAAYDFAPYRRVVDVGGGTGALIGGIVAAHDGLSGVLLDQPHVVAQAPAVLAVLGVAARCDVVGGDMFAEVPAGDLHVMKGVLHDWEDPEAAAILRSCRRAGTQVLVLERVLDGPNQGMEAKFSDLNMLVAAGGQERTADEFAALFQQGGFTLTRIQPTATRLSLIEGRA